MNKDNNELQFLCNHPCRDICKTESELKYCKETICYNQKEIKSLKAEVKRLKNRYKPDRYVLMEYNNFWKVKTRDKYPVDLMEYLCEIEMGSYNKRIPDAKERAEALCKELNEKARDE